MRARTPRAAFTLIELLVAIAIIGILIGLLLPAVQKVRETASRLKCTNNLHQIGIALHGYHDAVNGLPPGYGASGPYFDGANDTAPSWSWAAYILPYMEQGSLARSIDYGRPVEAPANAAAVATMLPLFLCPSDQTPAAAFAVDDPFGKPVARLAPSSYAACVGGDESDVAAAAGQGVFYRNSRTRFTEITDGLSETILVGEKSWSYGQIAWAGAPSGSVMARGPRNPNPGSPGGFARAPALVLAHSHLNNARTDTDGGLDDFSSSHIGGSNFLFADGSVHFIRSIPGDTAAGYSADSIAFQALGTRAGGEVVQGLDY
jgi:prepilin-type N-terminal cleavage/methylation domain-containing protein/prepilin-type processing-associated H-X9-DG protein